MLLIVRGGERFVAEVTVDFSRNAAETASLRPGTSEAVIVEGFASPAVADFAPTVDAALDLDTADSAAASVRETAGWPEAGEILLCAVVVGEAATGDTSLGSVELGAGAGDSFNGMGAPAAGAAALESDVVSIAFLATALTAGAGRATTVGDGLGEKTANSFFGCGSPGIKF